KVGRRTALIASVLNVSIATGAMALTPHGAWVYLLVCRFIMGFGVTGLYSVDITLMQEFTGSQKRGWITGLTTTMLPAGFLLGALLGAFATPYIGAYVPESPHWLLRRGRLEEARLSLAWALMIDPREITLPSVLPPVER